MCEEEGCDRPVRCKGLCNSHYRKSLRRASGRKLKKAHGTWVPGMCEGFGCTAQAEAGKRRCTPCADARRAKQRDRHAARSERERRDMSLFKYGIDSDGYDALLELQGGGCAICSAPNGVNLRPHAVDHDHACCSGYGSCGKCIRGILCMFCNNALGGYEKSGYMPDAFRQYLGRRVLFLGDRKVILRTALEWVA